MLSINSERELTILKQFQEDVSDLSVDQASCLRFLIARDFDLDKANDMLRNNIKWRSEVNVQYLLNDWPIPIDLKEDFKFSFTGASHKGGPVVWVPGGHWTVRRFVEDGRREDITKFSIKVLEDSLNRVKENGNKPLVAIYDFEGLTYNKVSHFETNRVIYSGFQIMELNYPEILETVVIVNAPYPFYIAWNIIRPLLSTRTSSKIRVFGSDKKKFVPFLRQLCPDDAIPQQYLI